MDTYQKILTKYWGYSNFRPLQHEVIQSVGSGKDTLALMPTGGGKSITFQVPALAKEGICIVVTPLIALMKDQVDNLRERGIKASAIYSGLTRHEIDITLENCVYDKNLKFLYCSPERLGTELFRTRLRQMNVNLLAIDESHCISQWGYDFRPSYMRITEIREMIPDVPVLAVTATATLDVVDDIQEKLGFKEKNVFRKSFARKNLIYLVRETEDKIKHLLKVANGINGTGLVYVRNRAKTKEIAQVLLDNGASADFYHAGLSTEERDRKQTEWKKGEIRIIVSTNAFGMGIDKANVRFVVHMDLPDTLEAYFQEAGRGGRDEKQAFAVLLYHPADRMKLERRIATTFPEIGEIKRTYEALCNFFQLPVGAGIGLSFDFNMADFAKSYRFNILNAYGSIKLLQYTGYIELSEDVDNTARLMFLINRDDLYRYQVANVVEDKFIKLLLRSYSGMFTDYQAINEDKLAKRANLSRENVYRLLLKLGRDKVINYIPRKNVPQIFFHESRLELKSLHFTKEKYGARKERYANRIGYVVQYASHNKCRSQQLLNYFGEDKAQRCGTCDVCTQRNQLDMSTYEFDLILDEIKKQVSENSFIVEELIDALGSKTEKSIKVIQWLLDNNKLVKNQDFKLSWSST